MRCRCPGHGFAKYIRPKQLDQLKQEIRSIKSFEETRNVRLRRNARMPTVIKTLAGVVTSAAEAQSSGGPPLEAPALVFVDRLSH